MAWAFFDLVYDTFSLFCNYEQFICILWVYDQNIVSYMTSEHEARLQNNTHNRSSVDTDY